MTIKLIHSATLMFCMAVAGCSSTGNGGSTGPNVSQAWLDSQEAALRTAMAGSSFTLSRTDNALVVTAPADATFNADRPDMLLPASLKPITTVAKQVSGDAEAGVLILGHLDNTLNNEAAAKLSQSRARAVASIFRLSGLKHDRLQALGLGGVQPVASNDSAAGRASNRRVEILVTQQKALTALAGDYRASATKLAAK
ncbi:MAG TPA: OmpA family protein [Pseudomonas sp.]|uniref:OmpA family protein n=1 Tax=Pseudomonas sp. TaxID=306 RepID=UPI002B642DAD|nr:OmpA family protein [Pseudomonas sp.]HTO19775.1 OmpA family protein [Pseudomonas sp.]